jgi:hypothetical protein
MHLSHERVGSYPQTRHDPLDPISALEELLEDLLEELAFEIPIVPSEEKETECST